jgi:hypothetical protein
MASIHITDLEAAINFWREKTPSPDGVTLSPELRALAEVYALMVFHRHDEAAEKGFPAKAWDAWPGTTPHLTHPALPFARPAKATLSARAAGAALTRCSAGPR